MRRLIALLAVVLGGLAAPSATGQEVPRTVSLMLVRQTSGPSKFHLDVTAHVPSAGAYFGQIFATLRGGRVVATHSGGLIWSKPDGGTAQVGRIEVSTCSVTSCESGAPEGEIGAGTDYDTGAKQSKGDFNAIFVVARGTDITFRLTGTGWRIVKVPLSHVMRLTRAASPASASIGPYGFTIFDGEVTAAGNRTGSVALAAPPCSMTTTGVVSRGLGHVQLAGGTSAPTFTCPTDHVLMSSYASRATTWSLHGTAAGDSTMADAALLVVNLPTRMPTAAP
jgi:hypothetical protein